MDQSDKLHACSPRTLAPTTLGPTTLRPTTLPPTTSAPSGFPTLMPSSSAELRSRVPTLAPTRAVLLLRLAVRSAADVRIVVDTVSVREGDAVLLELLAELQVRGL